MRITTVMQDDDSCHQRKLSLNLKKCRQEKHILNSSSFVFSMSYHTVINQHRLNGHSSYQQLKLSADNGDI